MSEVLVTNLMLAGLLLLFPTFSILLRQKQVGFAIVNFLSSVSYPHMCLVIITKLKRSSLHCVGNNICATHDLILHLMTIAVLSLSGILSLDWNF